MKLTEYLVDGECLKEQLDNPQVVIVDCRFKLADPDWGENPLPDHHLLGQKLAQMGIIKHKTLVVAYDDSRFAFASRLWWLLRYLGHNSVVLLDGGWHNWLEHDYPVSSELPSPRVGKFPSEPNPDWLVDIDTVKSVQNNDDVVIIDSRDRDRYLGLREPIDPIAGSIPSAVNSPWKQITNESGDLQPLAIQQQLWQDYQSAEEIIVYCGSGVTACVNLFSLSLSGFNNTKLYLGGWSDWCSYL